MKENKTPTEFKPANFEDLVFDQPAVEYDADVEQVIPFPVEKRTPKGVIESRLAHRIKAFKDERFLEREREFFDNEKKSVKSVEPSKKLWRDLFIEGYGYAKADDLAGSIPFNHQVNVLSGLNHIELISDKDENILEEEFLFDVEETTCLRFNVLYGGIALDEWKQWLSTGHLPVNLEPNFTGNVYLKVLSLIKRGISPSVQLEVNFYYRSATDGNIEEYGLIRQGKPRKGVFASAARAQEETRAARLLDLSKQVEAKTAGFKQRVPAQFRTHAVETYMLLQINELGKSLAN
ncbi:MAG: hypothetical protein WA584_23345 [Pyrinomonadaceae bacterium]